ncbi:proline dehydrogenase 1, mitochondrial [Trichonephila clavipes]|nr:proline dehydrogenase 1, mitochondrial [Trichonephila clavipes]
MYNSKPIARHVITEEWGCDEAHFWLNGYVNKQNCRIWSEANPQVYVETPLHPEKLTVWCALWADGIIGPYFFKNDEGHNVTVNGDRYRAMITNFFIPELNNHDVQELWFQQDGATCHTARTTIDLLKDTFGDRLISRFGPVNWPPRSCDLTPLDYFLWGYVKSLVYADKPQTLDHLEDNIRHVIADIRPQMSEKERLRAQKIGYEDPINESYEATTDMYHRTLSENLRRIVRRGDRKTAVMVATHNEDTVRFTVNKMEEMGIKPEHKVICFGQLYGMCDQVSFLLGQSGYSVYKYVPYGPIDEVLPYLSRRAQENNGLLKKSERERGLLRQEIVRRIASGQMVNRTAGNYRPI